MCHNFNSIEYFENKPCIFGRTYQGLQQTVKIYPISFRHSLFPEKIFFIFYFSCLNPNTNQNKSIKLIFFLQTYIYILCKALHQYSTLTLKLKLSRFGIGCSYHCIRFDIRTIELASLPLGG